MSDLKRISDRVDLLRRMPKGAVCAEFGAQRGIFSEKIWDVTQPKKMYLVDIWEPVKGLVNDDNHAENFDVIHDKFTEQIDLGAVDIKKGDSYEILKSFPDSYFDWVYLDDDPRYIHSQKMLSLLRKKVKPNGFICGRNYFDGDSNVFGVIEAVDQFCNVTEWYMSYLTSPSNTVNDDYARFLSYILENKYPKIKELYNPYKNVDRSFFPENSSRFSEILEYFQPAKFVEQSENKEYHDLALQYCLEVCNDISVDDADFYFIDGQDEKVLHNIFSIMKDDAIICLSDADLEHASADFEMTLKQFPYIRYFSRDLCIASKNSDVFDDINTHFKKELMVVCGTENYYPMAKAVFSSAFFSGLWQGDMMFICDRYSSKIAKDLKFRNIHYTVINQDVLSYSPLFNAQDLNMKDRVWNSATLMRYAIFYMDTFKKWNKVLYFDADILVFDKIDFHHQGEFCAAYDWTTIKAYVDHEPYYKRLVNDMGFESETHHTFNAGVFSVSTDMFDYNFRKRFFETNLKYLKYSLYVDQLIINAAFKDKVRIIDQEYNAERDYIFYDEKGIPAGCYNEANGVKSKFIQYSSRDKKKYLFKKEEERVPEGAEIKKTKILHFMGTELKPWNPLSHHYKTWKKYIDYFQDIALLESEYFGLENVQEEISKEKSLFFPELHYNDFSFCDSRDNLFEDISRGSTGLVVGAKDGEFAKTIFKNIAPQMMYLADPWSKEKGTGYELDGANDADRGIQYNECCERLVRESIDGKVAIIKQNSQNAMGSFPDKHFDWIYLDGNKTYNGFIQDLLMAEMKIKDNGVIIGHDYIKSGTMNYGVIESLRDFCSCRGWRLESVSRDEFPSFSLRKGGVVNNNFTPNKTRKVKEKISVCIPMKVNQDIDEEIVESCISSLLAYCGVLDEILIGINIPKSSMEKDAFVSSIFNKYRGIGKVKFHFYDEKSVVVSEERLNKMLFNKSKNDVVLFWDFQNILMQDFMQKYIAIKDSLVNTIFFFSPKILDRRLGKMDNKNLIDSYYHYYDNMCSAPVLHESFLIHKKIFNRLKKFYKKSNNFVSPLYSLSFAARNNSVLSNFEIMKGIRQEKHIVWKKDRENRKKMKFSNSFIFDDFCEGSCDLETFYSYDKFLEDRK